MKRQLADSLEACLIAFENGTPLEECLKPFSPQADQLRPLLVAVQSLHALDHVPSSAGVFTCRRTRVLAHANRMRLARPRYRTNTLHRLAIAVLLMVFLVLGGNGLRVASARSLPGDVLYPVMRVMEKTQLIFTLNPARRQDLVDEIRQRRIQEVNSLLSLQRVQKVEFEGVVTEESQNSMRIADLLVQIFPGTQISGSVSVGTMVRVVGHTETDGSVWALEIISEGSPEGGEAPETVNPAPTATVTLKSIVSNPQTSTPQPEATFTPVSTRPVSVITPTKTNEDVDDDNEEMELSGEVEEINADHWIIGGQMVTILPHTDIEEGITVGSSVVAYVIVDRDGSLVALEIDLLDNEGEDDENPPQPPEPTEEDDD